jgi:hypothetical protein
MATFSLTKNPLTSGINYPSLPNWVTAPGAMYALGIAMGELKSNRIPRPPSNPLNTVAAKKIKAERAKSQSVPWSESQATKRKANPISIVDIDMTPTSFASGGKSFDRITLPTVPLEVTYDPKPNWAVIASIARNSPFYHYTGSEDTLSFRIDWYSNMENRKDVIFYCRWLAARSKANGYYEDPHRVIIVWGEEDLLFSKDLWIVTNATYRLSQFQKQAGMLPNQAYQEVELKKVIPTNTDYDTILGSIMPVISTPSTPSTPSSPQSNIPPYV